MKTIVISSQKGGSGKTTLAAHLSVEAERAGDGAAWLVDTDKQATLSTWHKKRPGDTPQRLDVKFDQLQGGLRVAASKGAGWCFIDTAPTISEQNEEILALADLVLIPVRPSPSDLWAVGATVELVKDAGKAFLFVVMQAKAQASITAQTVAALSHHGRVAQTFIGDRVPYAAAMTGGHTAPELAPKSPAAAEITALWLDVKDCFHENLKSAKSSPESRELAHG